MTSRPLVIAVSGPTGIGKTEFAVELAKRVNGELISCDSVQVFKHLNIGANKYYPSVSDPPQHLVDIIEPTCNFSAGDFVKLCLSAVNEVISRRKVPIVVGGTGLYFDWLINGQPTAPVVSLSTIDNVKRIIHQDADWSHSLRRLVAIDPEYAANINENDYYRLTKAIGCFEEFGAPLSSFKRRKNNEHEWIGFYLTADREQIFRTIDRRCEKMIENGLVEETFDLMNKGVLLKDTMAARSIGYKETIDFIEGLLKSQTDSRILFEQYITEFSTATRNYARKQETWFSNKFKSEFTWLNRNVPMELLIDKAYQIVMSSNRNTCREDSDSIKALLRSKEGKEKRKKQLRTYRPTFSLSDETKRLQVLERILEHIGKI